MVARRCWNWVQVWDIGESFLERGRVKNLRRGMGGFISPPCGVYNHMLRWRESCMTDVRFFLSL